MRLEEERHSRLDAEQKAIDQLRFERVEFTRSVDAMFTVKCELGRDEFGEREDEDEADMDVLGMAPPADDWAEVEVSVAAPRELRLRIGWKLADLEGKGLPGCGLRVVQGIWDQQTVDVVSPSNVDNLRALLECASEDHPVTVLFRKPDPPVEHRGASRKKKRVGGGNGLTAFQKDFCSRECESHEQQFGEGTEPSPTDLLDKLQRTFGLSAIDMDGELICPVGEKQITEWLKRRAQTRKAAKKVAAEDTALAAAEADDSPDDDTDGYDELTMQALKGLLKDRGLLVGGTKDDLIQRLRQNDGEGGYEDDSGNEQAEVEMDYHELNVQALKVLLTDRGLPVKGKKAELIERLRKHDADDGSEREMDSNTEEEEEENASSSEEGD